jgi:hypothetical protein
MAEPRGARMMRVPIDMTERLRTEGDERDRAAKDQTLRVLRDLVNHVFKKSFS